MAHPYENLRANRVEKSRAASMAKGYARGGAVKTDDAPFMKGKPSAFKKSVGAIEGDKPKTRLDKFNRGGGVKKKGAKTNVNVIVAPQSGGDKPAMPPMVPPMAPPMAAAPPKPPMPPMVPPGATPPGLSPNPMIRKDGGRTVNRDHGGRFAKGGAVKMTAGAEGGLGRLQKIAAQKRMK